MDFASVAAEVTKLASYVTFDNVLGASAFVSFFGSIIYGIHGIDKIDAEMNPKRPELDAKKFMKELEEITVKYAIK